MGNKQAKQPRKSQLTLNSEVKHELVFYGSMRRIDKKWKNKHIPPSITELCFDYYNKYLYIAKFERIANTIFSNEICEALQHLISLLLKIKPSHIIGSDLKKLISGCGNDWHIHVDKYAKDYLQELGFNEQLTSYKPTTERCIKTALEVLNKSQNTFNLVDGHSKLSVQQFVLLAMKSDTNDIWKLLLITLPLFQRDINIEWANKEIITGSKILDTLKQNINHCENIQQIVDNIVFWMKTYWIEDFCQYENEEIQNKLEKDWLCYDKINQQYQKLKQLKEVKKQVHSDSIDDIKTDLDSSKWSTKDFAEQMTLIDHSLLCRVGPRELIDTQWRSNKDAVPNVMSLINQFNNVVMWIQVTILKANGIKQRAKTMTQFIKIGQHLKKLRNYFSFFMVYSALKSNAICRLKVAWSKVSDKYRDEFKEFAVIFKTHNNYRFLRKLFYNEDPCMPHIGLILQDLVFIEEGNEDSYRKYLKIGNKVKYFQTFQNNPYFYLTSDKQLQQYLLLDCDKFKDITEDEIWEASNQTKKADIDAN